MAYSPDEIVFDSWSSPINIVGTDIISNLDEAMEDIISEDPNSIKAFMNLQFAKMVPYLTGEFNKVYAETSDSADGAQLSKWEAQASKDTADSYATEAEDTFVKLYTSNGDGTFTVTDTAEYSALHYKNKAVTKASESLASANASEASRQASGTSETNSANSATASDASATASANSATASETSRQASETAETNSANSATASATSASESANSATASELSQWEAEAREMTAESYAQEPEDVLAKIYTSDGDGTFTATNSTKYSALHYLAKANTFDPSVYLPKAGGTMTGNLTVPSLTVSGATGYMENQKDRVNGQDLNLLIGTTKAYKLGSTTTNDPESADYGSLMNFNNGDANQQLLLTHGIDSAGSDIWFRTDNGSTMNAPWRRMWHDGNDGSGSGLDADKLDGVQASQFIRSDATDSKTAGTLTFNDNIYLKFGTGGDAEFFCNGSHMYTDLNSGIGNWYIRDGSTTRFTFDDAGHFTATGNVTAYSDARIKDNIEPIYFAMSKIIQLNGYTFDRTDVDVPRQTGVIAQEVLNVLPEAVTEHEDGKLSVAYGNMVGLLIEGIKELSEKVDILEERLVNLERK